MAVLMGAADRSPGDPGQEGAGWGTAHRCRAPLPLLSCLRKAGQGW